MAPNDVVDGASVDRVDSFAPDRSTTFVVDEYSGFAEHPVLLFADTWTPTSLNVVTTNDLFATYLALARTNLFVGRKLANFCYMDACLRVTVVVQGASVAQGKLVFSFDPVVTGHSGTNARKFSEPQATRAMILPHIEIDPAESKTYTLDLPCPGRYGLFTLSNTPTIQESTGSYSMKQHVINTLGSGTSVVPSITIAVYLSVVSPKMEGITSSVVFTSALRENNEKGIVSSYFRKAADISMVASVIPVPFISEGATLFSGVAGAAADFLAWFGYSKPRVMEIDRAVISTAENWSRVDGSYKTEVLGLRNNNSIGISKSICPLYDPADSVISNICAKPGLVMTFTIPTITAANTIVTSVQVAPWIYRTLDDPALVNGSELTPLGYCAFPYDFWSGDLIFDVEFVCSVFHRASVVILYDPSPVPVYAAAAPFAQYVGTLKHWTIHVNGHSRHKIKLPWKQLAPFRSCFAPAPSTAAFTTAAGNNGRLVFGLLNTVTTNGSTNPIHVNVYISGENMKFGCPATGRQVGPVFLTSASADDNFYHKYFGEESAHTVKELASRATTVITTATPVVSASTWMRINIGVVTVHDPAITVNGAGYTTTSTGDNLTDYLSLAYVGVRGSYNYVFFPNGGNTLPFTCSSVKFGGFNLPEYNPASTTSPMIPTTGFGAFTTTITKIKNSLEFTVPYYYPGIFRPTFQDLRGLVDTYVVTSGNDNIATTTAKSTLLKSAGDDFCFIGFRGVPVGIYQ